NPLAGANSSSLVVGPATTTDYSVTVTNSCGSVTSNTATISVSCAGPVITQKPQSQTINRGAMATLTVGASGSNPTYQWYGSDPAGSAYTLIVGAVSPALTVTPSSSVAGYFCRIGNECGKTVDSAVATATVQCEPKFFQQPQSQKSTNPGQQQIFMAVSVGSDTPVAYQWYSSTDFNFTPIAGATESFITVTPSQTTYYYCAAKNACGESQSFIATITVCYAPV